MKSIWIEKIYQCERRPEKGVDAVELAGIGSIWSSREKAINFLREVKEQQGENVFKYSEDELFICYNTFAGRYTNLSFEERYIA